MDQGSFRVEKLGWYLLIIALLYLAAIELKYLLAPLCFSVLIALVLLPIQHFFMKRIRSALWATVLTVSLVALVGGAVLVFFSLQLVEVFRDIPDIYARLRTGLEDLFRAANEYLGLTRDDSLSWIRENATRIIDAPVRFFSQGVSSSANFIIAALITLLGVFFLLFNKDVLKELLLLQFSVRSRPRGRSLLSGIRRAAGGYLSGLLVVIAILGVLNSLGLWLIGIDYPLFFGVLAAFMAVIPYFGTFLGGLLPFLYAVAIFPDWRGPALVLGWYLLIQQIEGNFITPRVIGSNVRINFLVSFLALLVGASMWGMAGLVLSLPMVAILKTVFDHIDALKPLGLLMGDGLSDLRGGLGGSYDADRYRLWSLFTRKKD